MGRASVAFRGVVSRVLSWAVSRGGLLRISWFVGCFVGRVSVAVRGVVSRAVSWGVSRGGLLRVSCACACV